MPASKGNTRLDIRWLSDAERESFNDTIRSMQTDIPAHYKGFASFTFEATSSNKKPETLIGHESISFTGPVMIVPTGGTSTRFDASNFRASIILRPFDIDGTSFTSTTVQDASVRVGSTKVMMGKRTKGRPEIQTLELSFSKQPDTKQYAAGHTTYRWGTAELTGCKPQIHKMPDGSTPTDLTTKLNELLAAMDDPISAATDYENAAAGIPKGMSGLLD